MNLVNDPLFPREAVGQYEDKPLKPQKPKKIRVMLLGNENREASKCPICEGRHDIEDCITILEQAVEKRSNTI